MARRLGCLSSLILLLYSSLAQAEKPVDRHGIVLDLPVVDLPFNLRDGLTGPAMSQSLALSAGFYQLLHGSLGFAIDPYEGSIGQRILSGVLIGAADLLATNLPLGIAWQHEEAHRAVLSKEKIASYNGIYQFHIFSSTTAVSKVDDDALLSFKSRDPGGFVRMSTAGLEANLELINSIEKTQLFYRTRAWHTVLFWQSYLINSAYLRTCSNKDGDRITSEAEQSESTNISTRDFTGLDCSAWVYDRFRPTEPYSSRGVHPSGVGIRRYRSRFDLSDPERRYLSQQFYLSLLNFIDPALLGLDWFSVEIGERRQTLRFNGHIRHMVSPFGQTINLETYAQYRDYNVALGFQGAFNQNQFFPGLNAEIHRFPLDLVIGKPITISAKTSLWLQPKAQQFQQARYSPGALGSLRLAYASSPVFEPYIEVEGKSAGWVPNSVWLSANATVRAGFVSTLFD